MWITLFGVALAASICLGVATVLLQKMSYFAVWRMM
jgi:hypothetical protein